MTDVRDMPNEMLARISECVQAGKADADTNIPSGTLGQPGVAELVEQAFSEGLSPRVILQQGLMAHYPLDQDETAEVAEANGGQLRSTYRGPSAPRCRRR